MTLDEFAQSTLAALKPLTLKRDVLSWAFTQPDLVKREGIWCEFGVTEGSSLKKIANFRGNAQLWGFDSFRGLPEDWREDHKKGRFAVTDIRLPPNGVNLVCGWFKDTLHVFRPDQPITFVHVDSDLYASCLAVFEHIIYGERPLVTDGTVIVFDELLTTPYGNGEMRALYETLASTTRPQRFSFEWLASHGDQAGIKLKAL